MNTAQVVFIINLLQDINILRPLSYLAARDLSLNTCFLVTAAFRKRDKTGLWQQELCDIAEDTQSPIHDFENEFQALQVLQAGRGALVAGSESHLEAHRQVHDLFRIAPSQYVKITLQHGFECVGFLQSREQNLAHGSNITFAADMICGWCAPERLTAVSPSQRHKLRITGPTALLPTPAKIRSGAALTGALSRTGLVCENMHSPRLNVAGDFKSEFLEIFEKFCAELGKAGQQVTLRPHPGGQYVIKNEVPLASNVVLENAPIYKIDLTQFAYGISAPSSILIDMVLAGIPTAVWQDEASAMDHGNYEGLTRISTLDEWLSFARDAVERPEHYREKQQSFLLRQKLLTTRAQVHREFSRVLRAVTNVGRPKTERFHIQARERIFFIAPNYIPTLQLSFLKPLASAIAAGETLVEVLTETHLNAEFKGVRATECNAKNWLKRRIEKFKPTVVIFCRWAGPHSKWLLDQIRNLKIPSIYHIDDDLLSIPKEIGLDKWEAHNKPEKLASVRAMLENVDLIYCSTPPLKQRLKNYDVKTPIVAGRIYCSSQLISSPLMRDVKTIGYMGIGHEADLESVLPAIVKYLKKYSDVTFELFGTIPVPNELKQFGDRIKIAPKVNNYDEFLLTLADLKWDIGICPLIDVPFNHLKANTKWVEYSAVGTAVIASKGTIYDSCCGDNCGVLADSVDEWFSGLEYLTLETTKRVQMIQNAQNKVLKEYNPAALRMQIAEVVDKVFEINKKNNFSLNKVIFVSNSYVPTLQLSFVKPLSKLTDSGELEFYFISEVDFKTKKWKQQGCHTPEEWIGKVFESFGPDLVVFCRYSGPHARVFIENSKKYSSAAIYHIDDDLLGIPKEIGEEKYINHNKEFRLDAVRYLLDASNIIYCSTQRLKQHLLKIGVKRHIHCGQIYCAGQVINPAKFRPVKKIGYMASADHAHNLTQVLGALVRLLRKHSDLNFEFFGSIPAPPEFAEFGERISHAPPISDYGQFLQKFAEYQWDIGICPLSPIHFNMMKANTKWVEYTSVGAAVVASKGTVYDECCADGCGLLASSEEEWFAALDSLVSDPKSRFRQVMRAQKKLHDQYSVERLRDQVLDVFTQACQLAEQSS